MNILEALWGGAVRPCERTVKRGSEYDRVRHEASEAYDRFWAMLTPEAKAAYDTYSEEYHHLMSISEADSFIKGFRLGAQLLLAAICEDDTQLPPLEEY
jgi:hypothetical protein